MDIQDTFTLLIVDDEVEIREMIRDVLNFPNMRVTLAGDGKEALDLCLKTKFDVIISDLHMPQMDGIGFLKGLRDNEILTPFIFLSGYADKVNAIQALRLGAFDFIEKPFDPQVINQAISDALKHVADLQKVEEKIKSISEHTNLSQSEKEQMKSLEEGLAALRSIRRDKKSA